MGHPWDGFGTSACPHCRLRRAYDLGRASGEGDLKILIVDDHQLIRDGLRPVLERVDAGGEPVEVLEVEGHPEAVACADANPGLGLILLDLRLPNVSGFAALIDLQERHPDIPVIIMSGLDDGDLVREALDRGARGFIPKTSPSSVILNAVRLVLSGGTYVPREIMSAPRFPLEESPPSGGVTASELGLTPRQAEVLAQILAGKSNKMICRELGLSEGTVKNHVAAVLKALRVTTRVQAVVAATRMGLRVGGPAPRR